jgi:hypothetical protein
MFENTDSTLVPFVDTQRTGHRRGRILWQSPWLWTCSCESTSSPHFVLRSGHTETRRFACDVLSLMRSSHVMSLEMEPLPSCQRPHLLLHCYALSRLALALPPPTLPYPCASFALLHLVGRAGEQRAEQHFLGMLMHACLRIRARASVRTLGCPRYRLIFPRASTLPQTQT